MISKFSHKVISIYFRWTNAIHIFPYIYNKGECQIELSSDLRKWFLISALSIVHTVFTLWRLFQDYFFQEGRVEDFLFRFFFIAAYGLAFTNQLNSLVNYKEIASLMTMYMRQDRAYTGKYGTNYKIDLLGIFVGLLFPSIVLCQEILYIGIYLYDPKSPNFFNSYLNTEPYSWTSILMFIPEMVLFIYAWSSVYWSLLISYTFQMSLNHWLKRLSVKNIEPAWRMSGLLNRRAIMHSYRQMQILTQMFNNTMSGVYQPLHTLFMGGCCISCAFTTVHCYGNMHWFAYTLNPLTAIAVVIYFSISSPTAAGILDHSEEFISCWKTFTGSSEMKKFLRSCPGLKIRIGSQYYVKKQTLFTFLNILVNQTIALLVGVR